MIDFKRLMATALTLATIAIFTQPVGAADTDDAEILALYQGWIRAVEDSNIDRYVNGLHPDVSLRPPGVPGLDGRANYREFLGPVFKTARYEITIDTPKDGETVFAFDTIHSAKLILTDRLIAETAPLDTGDAELETEEEEN